MQEAGSYLHPCSLPTRIEDGRWKLEARGSKLFTPTRTLTLTPNTDGGWRMEDGSVLAPLEFGQRLVI